MTSVTVDRVAAVHAHVVEAVTRTTTSSTLPEAEQVRLLAQGCAEACDLLRDWVHDPYWERGRPAHDRPLKQYVPTRQEFAKFLGPMLEDAMVRAGQGRISVDESLVDQARDQLAATARRFPRMGHQQLFDEARKRTEALQQEVCGLAGQLADATRPAADPARRASWRRMARKALGKVPGALLAVVMVMAGAGPHAVAQNAAAWGQAAAQAAEVVAVHYLADQAQPGVQVASPRAGPRLR
jgi:hypothetical protein